MKETAGLSSHIHSYLIILSKLEYPVTDNECVGWVGRVMAPIFETLSNQHTNVSVS